MKRPLRASLAGIRADRDRKMTWGSSAALPFGKLLSKGDATAAQLSPGFSTWGN
jgi:hypothetical protein